MVRSLILTAALTVGLATVAQAGFAPHSIGNSDSSIVRVAEGYHLGPEGERCWPN
jgi:hypothetical protein